jgi:DNA-binding MarR family transcriptional regulator
MNRPALKRSRQTRAARIFTELLLEVFRLNGRLLASGDRLTADLGLTSARWQVLGAIEPAPATASQIARLMGLQRQSVQRLVDILVAEGIVERLPNPSHRRAKLFRVTASGRRILDTLRERQISWSNRVTRNAAAGILADAVAALRDLRHRLEADDERRTDAP